MFGFKKKVVTSQPLPESDLYELVDRQGDRYWSYSEGGIPGKLVHFFRPGEENRRHVITLVVATLKKGSHSQLLTIQDEGHMALRSYVHGFLVVDHEFLIRVGKAAQVTLDVSFDADEVASLTVWGYTEDMHPDDDDVLP